MWPKDKDEVELEIKPGVLWLDCRMSDAAPDRIMMAWA